MNTDTNSHTTPPGYWFGAIDHELRNRMRDELSGFDLRRGSWRVLSTIADGTTSVDDIAAALPPRHGGRGSGRGRGGDGRGRSERFGRAERFGRSERFSRSEHFGRAERLGYPEHHGRPDYFGRPDHFGRPEHFGSPEHHGRPEHFGRPDCAEHDRGYDRDRRAQAHHHHEHPRDARREHQRNHRVEATIADFAERGWVARSGERNETVELTEAGRAAYASALERIQGLRESMTAGISEADYATTIATLEAMARNLGWREPSTSRSTSPTAESEPTTPESEPTTPEDEPPTPEDEPTTPEK